MRNYFPHDSNARNSERLIRLRMKHGAEGYGVYFMILERLREEAGYVSASDYEMMAFDFRVDVDLVRSVVEDFGLFMPTADGKGFYSESLKRRMEYKDEKLKKRSEAGKCGAQARHGNSPDESGTQPDGGAGETPMSNSELRSMRMRLAREKGTHTKEEWEEMKSFFNECVICGSKDKLVKDHITPIYQGGSDAITNLQPLCQSCNSRKGSDNTDYRLAFCLAKNVEMPGKWLAKNVEMPGKKSKVKGSKIKHTLTSVCENAAPEASAHAPTQEEVSDFVKSEGLDVDAARFFDYYAARGWRINGTQVADWRPLARNWSRSEPSMRPRARSDPKGGVRVPKTDLQLMAEADARHAAEKAAEAVQPPPVKPGEWKRKRGVPPDATILDIALGGRQETETTTQTGQEDE